MHEIRKVETALYKVAKFWIDLLDYALGSIEPWLSLKSLDSFRRLALGGIGETVLHFTESRYCLI